jgi:flagellin-specific chaperone FliS
MFDKGKVDKAMEYLTNLMIQYVEDEKVTKKLHKLYNYLVNNHDGLVPYKLNRKSY